MRDLERLFLMSLAALPACRDDDVGGAEGRCRDAVRETWECYGYGGGPDTRQYAAMLCEMIRERAEPEGPECVEADLDVFACISVVQCRSDADEPVEECDEVRQRAHEQCPQHHGLCIIDASGQLGPCSAGGSHCLDGRTYDVVCDYAGGGLDCTCRIDGVDVGTYHYDGQCDSFDFVDPAEEACGFPPNTY